MKTTTLKSVLMTLVAMTTMSFTTVAAQAENTFYYGADGNILTVSTLNPDGKTLTPKLRYAYRYNEEGAVTEKKPSAGIARKAGGNPTTCRKSHRERVPRY